MINVHRKDLTNVGDAFCAPGTVYPAFSMPTVDIVDLDPEQLDGHVVVGGGGLVAKTFHGPMAAIAGVRKRLQSLVAWGIGESETVDRRGGFVLPFAGALPDYLSAFDLVGMRDDGTRFDWVPCVSCMLPQFDQVRPAPTHDIAIYQHKRIPLLADADLPRRTNEGADLDAVLDFLASAEVIITNSYHGAYWATLLGRRVVAIPNMSKMYRFRHPPVLCREQSSMRYAELANPYPTALQDCRAANRSFAAKVAHLLGLPDLEC